MPEVPVPITTTCAFQECPKYACHELTDAQIHTVAVAAAKVAIELVKEEAITATGTFVLSKVAYVVGLASLALLAYATKIGAIEWR